MIIRSRVPLRISFAGGGTDVSPFCDLKGGYVLNATINRYATVSLIPNENKKIIIKSIDYDLLMEHDIDEEMIYNGQLDILKGVIKNIKKIYNFQKGFNILAHNDAPPGSGLGSSSAICVALIGALKEWLNLPLSPYDIAELAYKIEREELGIKGGRQDQYAAAFGGFNFIEFNSNRTLVNPLKLNDNIIEELNYNLILGYIGGSRNSSEILSEQIKNVKKNDSDYIKIMEMQKNIALQMKNELITGNLLIFGKLIMDSWELKKKMANGITNDRIDFIYKKAIDTGALGGKLTGAGGGGFMILYSNEESRYEIIKSLEKNGVQIINYSFEEKGLRTWTVF